MKNVVLPITLLAAATFSPASAAIMDMTSVTIDAGVLTSIDAGGDTYSTLFAPSLFVDNGGPTNPFVSLDLPTPTTLAEAIGGLDITTGALNYNFEAQFSVSSLDNYSLFIMNHTTVSRATDEVLVFALDASGNRLNANGVILPVGNNATVVIPPMDFNRNGGTVLQDRQVFGTMFTLADLGLDGLGAVGIEIDAAGTYDTLVVGAAIPEPTTYALIMAGVCLVFVGMRRKVRR